MPGRPRGGKRKQWKRKPKRRSTVLVNRALQPIAQRYIAKMKYSEVFSLSALSSTFRFNLNSIWDPNRTGIGNQPYSRDTFETIYNRYRVIKCSWVITAYNANQGIRVAAILGNGDISPSGVSDIVTNPRCKFIVQYPGGNTNKLKGSVYLPSLMGRNKSQYMADDNYQAQMNASPSELAVLNIFGANLADAAVDSTNCQITLTYTVELFDIKNLSQS